MAACPPAWLVSSLVCVTGLSSTGVELVQRQAPLMFYITNALLESLHPQGPAYACQLHGNESKLEGAPVLDWSQRFLAILLKGSHQSRCLEVFLIICSCWVKSSGLGLGMLTGRGGGTSHHARRLVFRWHPDVEMLTGMGCWNLAMR